MTRLRDALNKVEGGERASAPVLHPREPMRAGAEPVSAGRPGGLPASLPEFERGVPDVAPLWPADALPGIPAEFHRELSALRFSVESAMPDRATRVVLFTAAVPGEGTTTVAASFARILAQDPTQSVLLVDANVRRPGLALYFGLPAGPGLREIVQAGQAMEAAVQPVERQNLHVLPALPMVGESAHLFALEAVREFWAVFGRRYQWVIVDAAPILEAPETAMLATTVDTTLVVIQAARTKRGVVTRAMDVFGKAGAPVLGAVLNRRRLDIPEFIYRRT